MDQGQWQTVIVTQAGYPVERFIGVEHTWWQNPINPRSLRLTANGFKWAGRHAGIVFHATELQEKILPKQMLQLERLLTSPYYIKSLKILYVVSETDAVMLQLHGGNLNQYLDNLQNQG